MTVYTPCKHIMNLLESYLLKRMENLTLLSFLSNMSPTNKRTKKPNPYASEPKKVTPSLSSLATQNNIIGDIQKMSVMVSYKTLLNYFNIFETLSPTHRTTTIKVAQAQTLSIWTALRSLSTASSPLIKSQLRQPSLSPPHSRSSLS